MKFEKCVGTQSMKRGVSKSVESNSKSLCPAQTLRNSMHESISFSLQWYCVGLSSVSMRDEIVRSGLKCY